MKCKLPLFWLTLMIFVFSLKVYSQDKLIDLMSEELKRNMDVLKAEETPPYFISYRVDEVHNYYLSSSFGNLKSSNKSDERNLIVMVRVGSNKLDNFHELREDMGSFTGSYYESVIFPLESTPAAVKQTLWLNTNDKYRKAITTFEKVKGNVAVKVETEDKSEDFSREKPVVYIENQVKPEEFVLNTREWEARLCGYSKLFLDDPNIITSSVSLNYEYNRKYYVSTEGTKIAQNRISATLQVWGEVQAEDGMVLPLYKTYFVNNIKDLPPDDVVLKDIKTIVGKLTILKKAPIVEPYAGPAILSASSSGVFFHEIFGHRVEGQRMKSEDDAQTFKKKLKQKVLPNDMTVYFDPTIKNYKGNDLNGSYVYDDEGIKGSKVVVVENGILKGFLMSRTPIDSFPNSNGHGRAYIGKQPVARQSNLIVETSKPYTTEQLRKMLIEELKKQGKEYGYLFADVTGGFTMTGRFIPNAFNVMPTEVYKVYVDGRPDEMVRGVDLVGTPLSIFSEIDAAGNDFEVFTGTCGAESGGVPVTCISPTLFVKKIELQKKSKEQSKPPILPRP